MTMAATETPAGLMYVQCCFCREFIGSKPGPLASVSHGVCEKCLKREMEKLEAETKQEDACCADATRR